MELKGRKTLTDELTKLNEGYQRTKLDMEKAGASQDQLRRLYDKRVVLENQLKEMLGDDLMKLNEGQSLTVKGGTVSGALGALNQSKVEDLANKPLVGKEGMFRKLKKGLKTVPAIGSMIGGYSALQSGDAAAAIPGLDSAESAGMSAEDEKIMLAEDQALRNYINSPASQQKEQGMSPEQIKARREALVKRVKGF